MGAKMPYVMPEIIVCTLSYCLVPSRSLWSINPPTRKAPYAEVKPKLLADQGQGSCEDHDHAENGLVALEPPEGPDYFESLLYSNYVVQAENNSQEDGVF